MLVEKVVDALPEHRQDLVHALEVVQLLDVEELNDTSGRHDVATDIAPLPVHVNRGLELVRDPLGLCTIR
jgi:hypothetical protein